MTKEEFEKYIVPYLNEDGTLDPWEVGKEIPYHQDLSSTEPCKFDDDLITGSTRIWKDVYLYNETDCCDKFFWSPKNLGEKAIYKAFELYKLKRVFKV